MQPWMFDADNHYYEPEDVFDRYGDATVRKFVRWIADGHRRHLMFGSRIGTAIPNPTFDPIAKPGAFHARLKELETGSGERVLSSQDRRRYGELEPLPPEYRDRARRLEVMDRQGLERAILFPTLGVGVEGLIDDPAMTYRVFEAFNRWLEEDWGFAHENRLYGAPHVPLVDPDLAAAAVESLVERGARLISVRPGPADGRSPADPVWDPFWARVNEAEVPVCYHGYAGPDAYDAAFELLWERQTPSDRSYQGVLRHAWRDSRPVLDTLIALILGNLFGRFPNVRIASVELGSAWVPYCLHVLDHAGALLDRSISAFGTAVDERPSEIFKEKVFVSPFPEEDVVGLIELLGDRRVLFGSDWPHPEGNVVPGDFGACLAGLGDDTVRRVMRENSMELLGVS